MQPAFRFNLVVVLWLGLLALSHGQPQRPPAQSRSPDKAKTSVAQESRYQDARETVRVIKSRGSYHDYGAKQDNTWIARAGNSLGDFMRRSMEGFQPKPPQRDFGGGGGGVGAVAGFPFTQFLMNGVLVLLGGVVIAFLFFAIRQFRWKGKLKRKSKAILEEDEPERSLDEWLSEADRLAAEGRYRESCRALYLACLLRYDEANIARFLRGETNWEHLRRIDASPARPTTFDFEPATQAFDRVWYGFRVQGQYDVDQFRAWYISLAETLVRGNAA